MQKRTDHRIARMSDILPSQAFPEPADEPGIGLAIHTTQYRSLRVLSVKAEVNGGAIAPTKQTSPSVQTIQVAMDRSQEDEILEDYRRHLSYVLFVAFIVCIVVGYQIAQRGIRPIHEITRTAGGTGPGNLDQRIALRGLPAELHELAGTFNAMLNRLEKAFDRLSRFSADIAHELRTPVNNLRGEFDVALQKQRSPEEYEELSRLGPRGVRPSHPHHRKSLIPGTIRESANPGRSRTSQRGAGAAKPS